RVESIAKARFAFQQRIVAPQPLGDVASDSAVTLEVAQRIEERFSADRDVMHHAQIRTLVCQIPEGLPRMEYGAMRVPFGFGHAFARQFPARLPKDVVDGRFRPAEAASAAGGESVVLILFPVPIGGETGNTLEARLALAQFADHLCGKRFGS